MEKKRTRDLYLQNEDDSHFENLLKINLRWLFMDEEKILNFFKQQNTEFKNETVDVLIQLIFDIVNDLSLERNIIFQFREKEDTRASYGHNEEQDLTYINIELNTFLDILNMLAEGGNKRCNAIADLRYLLAHELRHAYIARSFSKREERKKGQPDRNKRARDYYTSHDEKDVRLYAIGNLRNAAEVESNEDQKQAYLDKADGEEKFFNRSHFIAKNIKKFLG